MAKKKSQKKQRPEGYDPNEKRRERLEERRREKERALQARRRAQQRERLVRYVLIAGLLTAAVWFLFFRGQPPSEINGHTIRDLSAAGANDHRVGVQEYETDPPVSGPHDQSPAPCGVHAERVTNENFVHTLEHGAVAIVYQPTLDVRDIRSIEGIVDSFDSHVLSAPNETMDSPIAVAAWGRLMELEELDEGAIREFIEVFRQGGEAPEANQPCPNDTDRPFEPQATPGATGGPSPAPTGTAEEGRDRDRQNGGGGD